MVGTHIQQLSTDTNFTLDLDYLIADPSCNGDALKMWPRIEREFPSVAKMAQDVLCIPAAGVGCERAFSIARHQARFNRSYSLSTFTNIMMCRHRLRTSEVEHLLAEERLGQTFDDKRAVEEQNECTDEVLSSLALCGISEDEGEDD